MPIITQASIYERSSVTLMARITGYNHQAITQASLTDIDYEAWLVDPPKEPPLYLDEGQPVIAIEETEVTIADVIFDSLQTTDPCWTVDSTGYNFKITLPAATFGEIDLGDFPDSQSYRVPFRFTPTSGDPFFIVYVVRCEQMLFGKPLA